MNVIVNFRVLLGLLLALALGLVSGAARADGDSVEIEAQRLVHILSYVAADYGGAVKDGVVKSESELAEQRALVQDASKIASQLDTRSRTDFARGVGALAALVDAKAKESAVEGKVTELRLAIVATYHLVEAPKAPPDRERGKALFAEHCATCHGATGRADTERASTLSPHPANFHDPEIAGPLTPNRVQSTILFGINGTAMAPMAFLSDADRWALAFHVLGLRHEAAPASDAPAYTLAELAGRSDEELESDLRAAGVAEDRFASILADLRRRAPYEDRVAKSPLGVARTKLDRAHAALVRGDVKAARAELLDAYLEGIEPAEGALNAADPSITAALEAGFLALRAKLEAGAPPVEVEESLAALLRDVTRAEAALAPTEAKGALSTAISSGGILLREGVEAALLVAALLGVARQAGLEDKKRWVHAGWAIALLLGLVTWIVSSKIIAISGAHRETIEGVTALLATVVLFYVSYSLLAKKEVARWMKFLRAQVTPQRAALSLFAVAFLAAYREAFETVLFYQALLSSNAPAGAAIGGAAAGAVLLVVIVALYSRAGKFAPPQTFFKVSSFLLYALAVVFAGQGVAALQVTGLLPVHALGVPSVPAIGLSPSVEACAAQATLVALALLGAIVNAKRDVPAPAPADARPTG